MIFCTQSPDFYLPTTACIVQDRLGIPQSAGALDINLGCSGFVYSLGLATALIASGQAKNVLIITADTYSKFINPGDKSVRTIFGDGASATLVADEGAPDEILGFTYGTDGSGAAHLMVPNGGLRSGRQLSEKVEPDKRGLVPGTYDLYMNGPEIFNFTIRVVPQALEQILHRADLTLEEIDLFVFHQANKFMLDHLRKSLGISEEKFLISMGEKGNTVSSTIPIALSDAAAQGALKSGMKVLILGFGVGLSWGGAVISWV